MFRKNSPFPRRRVARGLQGKVVQLSDRGSTLFHYEPIPSSKLGKSCFSIARMRGSHRPSVVSHRTTRQAGSQARQARQAGMAGMAYGCSPVRLPDEGDFSVVASTSQTKGAGADSRLATLRHKRFQPSFLYRRGYIRAASYPESNNTDRSSEAWSAGLWANSGPCHPSAKLDVARLLLNPSSKRLNT